MYIKPIGIYYYYGKSLCILIVALIVNLKNGYVNSLVLNSMWFYTAISAIYVTIYKIQIKYYIV